MTRFAWGFKGWLTACALAALIPSAARAEDVYCHWTVGELTITEGTLPQGAESRSGTHVAVWLGDRGSEKAMQPYAALEGAGEIYLDRAAGDLVRPLWGPQLDGLFRDDVVAVRVSKRGEITGRLFAPRKDGKGMVAVSFRAVPPADQGDARAVFASAKQHHYERLSARNLPGTAWFRHQIREARALAPAGPGGRPAQDVAAPQRTTLEQTYALFTGGRAISENLQLDRPLPRGRPVEPSRSRPTVPLDRLRGITVAEIDWKARLEGRPQPALDPLAAHLPADQHALFLPDLKAAAGMLAEFHEDALPVLRLIEPRSEDSRVQRRYERQLGVSLEDLRRLGGRAAIRSIAVTGSDPYLPTGTDLAILFETEDPEPLTSFFRQRCDAARRSAPDAQAVDGARGGVAFFGARSPDRSLSVFVATVGKVVVIANSPVQVERVVDASLGKLPTLAEQPEYRLYRDRYRRGEGEESALLVLTDATIRRWCGPRWRIASSRRLRAAALLAELQADHIRAIAEQKAGAGDLAVPTPAPVPDPGRLRLTPAGVWSSTYGTLDFLTPIAELPLTEVERSEADAYERWRDTYQQNWRGVFDPIAVRVALRPGRLAADVSVLPLIASSNYRPYVQLVGNAEIAPGAGDRHPEALVHAIMALDVQSQLMRSGGDFLANLTHAPLEVVLGWLGSSIAVYLDDDPFWKELEAADDVDRFVREQIARLPLGLHAEVTDGAKLALFLTAVRAFVEQSAPDLVSWETRAHGGRHYVRVAERADARPGAGGPKLALYYATTPRALVVSLNEAVVTRFLERQDHKARPGSEEAPWLGTSLALRVSPRGLQVLGGSGKGPYREAMQRRAWSNLPILNEWKRLFPDRDPVALHETVWGMRLVDPGGGSYVWNATWQTMESTVYGHPGAPKPGPETARVLEPFRAVRCGVSFQDGGLRAKAEIELRRAP